MERTVSVWARFIVGCWAAWLFWNAGDAMGRCGPERACGRRRYSFRPDHQGRGMVQTKFARGCSLPCSQDSVSQR
jgi:hypothetical protein